MVSKKKKAKNPATGGVQNSSDDDAGSAGPTCLHITKALNVSGVRKNLESIRNNPSIGWGKCTTCCKNSSSSAKEEYDEAGHLNIGICLRCGHAGCRPSDGRPNHCEEHFKTPRSDCHALCLVVVDWSVWCFACNKTVPLPFTSRLSEVVETIKKLVDKFNSLPPPTTSAPGDQPSSPVGAADEAAEKVIPGTPSAGDMPPQDKYRSATPSLLKKGRFVESGDLPEVRGLANNGNTCFFNSTLQALNQCHHLTQILDCHIQKQESAVMHPPSREAPVEKDNENDEDAEDDEEELNNSLEPLKVNLPESEAFLHVLLEQFRLMHTKSTTKGPLNPRGVFSQLCRRAKQFEGGEQHDAQELLRHFMEHIRQEELKRYKRALLDVFKLSPKTNPKEVNERTRNILKGYSKRAEHDTIVDWIFGGQFINTIVCEECLSASQRIEPFLDISLPIMDETVLRHGTRRASESDNDTSCFGASQNAASSVKKKKPEKLCVKPKGKKARDAARRSKKDLRRQAKLLDAVKKDEAEEEGVAGSGVVEKEADEGKQQDGVPMEVKKMEKVEEEEEEDDGEEEDDDPEEEDGDGDDDEDELASQENEGDVEDNVEALDARFSTHGIHADAVSTNSGVSMDSGVLMGQSCPSQASQAPSNCDTVRPTPSPHNGEDTSSTSSSVAASQASRQSQDSGWASLDNTSIERSPDASSLNDDHAASSTTTPMVPIGPQEKNTTNDCSICEELGEKLAKISIAEDEKVIKEEEVKVEVANQEEEDSAIEEKARGFWKAACMSAIGVRKSWHPNSGVNVDSLLAHYTSPEIMSGANKFACAKCNKRMQEKEQDSSDSDAAKGAAAVKKRKLYLSNANRQALILIPPAVLTLHLKRFEQTSSFTLRKVTKHVDFPFVLDLAPYTASPAKMMGKEISGKTSLLYSLFAIVEHIGTLRGGHYVAYVKVRKARPLDDVRKTLNCSMETTHEAHFQNFFSRWKETSADLTEVPESASFMPSAAAGGDTNEEGDVSDKEVPGVWYYVSDSHSSKVDRERVARSQAYLLFYERVA